MNGEDPVLKAHLRPAHEPLRGVASRIRWRLRESCSHRFLHDARTSFHACSARAVDARAVTGPTRFGSIRFRSPSVRADPALPPCHTIHLLVRSNSRISAAPSPSGGSRSCVTRDLCAAREQLASGCAQSAPCIAQVIESDVLGRTAMEPSSPARGLRQTLERGPPTLELEHPMRGTGLCAGRVMIAPLSLRRPPRGSLR